MTANALTRTVDTCMYGKVYKGLILMVLGPASAKTQIPYVALWG